MKIHSRETILHKKAFPVSSCKIGRHHHK